MSILILTACLINAPQTCLREQIGHPVITPACMVASMPAAAQWAGNHPDYQVTMIRCEEVQA